MTDEAARDETYEDLRAGFTAVVSHELRTPLARVLALLDSASLTGSDPATVLPRIRAEIEEMRELVDDVLFLAELESGRAVVALRPVRALRELERLAEEYRERAERAAVRIEVSGDGDVKLPLRRRMLCVVAENLIANTLRYAGPGTTLTLTVGRTGGELELIAADGGPGVEEADLARLFERFYRGDRARASHGTGLGLAIVKHVVNAAGGTVEARRAAAGGLEVRCAFPAPG